MNPSDPQVTGDTTRSIGTTAFAGLVCWAAISLGFLGLKMLMQERPQFVGQPLSVTKAVLVQESPQVVTRKVSDDVSVIKQASPEFSDVHFNMNGRRDYRGLKTINAARIANGTRRETSAVHNERLSDGLDAVVVGEFFDGDRAEALAFRHQQEAVLVVNTARQHHAGTQFS